MDVVLYAIIGEIANNDVDAAEPQPADPLADTTNTSTGTTKSVSQRTMTSRGT
jgi:hypothetical protein